MLANFCKSCLGVGVLRDDGVVHRFELQIFGDGRRGGEFLLKGLPSIGGSFVSLKEMDEVGVDGHGESAKALVIGIMPGVDPRLVGHFASDVVVLGGRFTGSDGPPCTSGAEVTGDEWGPLEIVGAFKSGDAGDEGGGHFGRVGSGIRDVSKPSTMGNKEEGGIDMHFMTLSEPGTSET